MTAITSTSRVRCKPPHLPDTKRSPPETHSCRWLFEAAFSHTLLQPDASRVQQSTAPKQQASHFTVIRQRKLSSAASRSSQSSSPANRLLARLRVTLRVTLRYGSAKALYGYVTLRVPYLGYRNRNRTFGNHTKNQKQLLRTAPAIHALVDQPLGLQR
jgi:hypothetical protein